MNNKKILILVTVIMALCLVMLLSSCGENVSIESIAIKVNNEELLTVEIGEFNYSDYSIEVKYSNGTVEEITLTADMLSSYDKLKIYQTGKQTITVQYKGQTCALDIVVVSKKQNGVYMNGFTTTYDGKDHTVQVEGDIPEGASIVYSPQQTFNTAGIYEVTAIVSAPEFETTTLRTTVTINKALYDFSCVEFEDSPIYTYDGAIKSLTAKVDSVNYSGLPQGVKISYTLGTIEGRYENDASGNYQKSAGIYYVSCIFSGDTKNYESSKFIKDGEVVDCKKLYGIDDLRIVKVLTIKKASAEALLRQWGININSITFDDQDWDYTGQARSIQVSIPANLEYLLSNRGIRVEYYYKGKLFTGVRDAGEYEIEARFKIDSTVDYEIMESMTATLTINKINYDMSKVTFESYSLAYDGNVHMILVDGLPGNVEVSEYLVNDAPYNGVGYSDAGQYVIEAILQGDNNHFALDPLYATLEIGKINFGDPIVEFYDKNVEYSEGGSYEITYAEQNMPLGIKHTISYVDIDGQTKEGLPKNKNAVGQYVCTATYTFNPNNYNYPKDLTTLTATLTIATREFDAAKMVPLQIVEKEYTKSDLSYLLNYSVSLPSWVSEVEDSLIIRNKIGTRLENGNVWEAGVYSYEYKFQYFNGVETIYTSTTPTRFKIIGIPIYERTADNPAGQYAYSVVDPFTYDGVTSCMPTMEIYFAESEHGTLTLNYYYTEFGKSEILVSESDYATTSIKAGIHRFSYEINAYNYEPHTKELTVEIYRKPFNFITGNWSVSNGFAVPYDGLKHNDNLVTGSQDNVKCEIILQSTLETGMIEGVSVGNYIYQVTFTSIDTNYVLSNPGDTTITITINPLVLLWGYNPYDVKSYDWDQQKTSTSPLSYTTTEKLNKNNITFKSAQNVTLDALDLYRQKTETDLTENEVKCIRYEVQYDSRALTFEFSASNTSSYLSAKNYDDIFNQLIKDVVNDKFTYHIYYKSPITQGNVYTELSGKTLNSISDAGEYIIILKQNQSNIKFYNSNGLVIKVVIDNIDIPWDDNPYVSTYNNDTIASTAQKVKTTGTGTFSINSKAYVFKDNGQVADPLAGYHQTGATDLADDEVYAFGYSMEFKNTNLNIAFNTTTISDIVTSNSLPNYYNDLINAILNNSILKIYYRAQTSSTNEFVYDSSLTLTNIKHAGQYIIVLEQNQTNIIFHNSKGIVLYVNIAPKNFVETESNSNILFGSGQLYKYTDESYDLSNNKIVMLKQFSSLSSFDDQRYAQFEIEYNATLFTPTVLSNYINNAMFGDVVKDIQLEIVSRTEGNLNYNIGIQSIKNGEKMYPAVTYTHPYTCAGEYVIFVTIPNDIQFNGSNLYILELKVNKKVVNETDLKDVIKIQDIDGTVFATYESLTQVTNDSARISYTFKHQEPIANNGGKILYVVFDTLSNSLLTENLISSISISGTNPEGKNNKTIKEANKININTLKTNDYRLLYDGNTEFGTTVGHYTIVISFIDNNVLFGKTNDVAGYSTLMIDLDVTAADTDNIEWYLKNAVFEDANQEWGGYTSYTYGVGDGADGSPYNTYNGCVLYSKYVDSYSVDNTNWNLITDFVLRTYSVASPKDMSDVKLKFYVKLNPAAFGTGTNNVLEIVTTIHFVKSNFTWVKDYCYQVGTGEGETAQKYQRYSGGVGAYDKSGTTNYINEYVFDNSNLILENDNFKKYSQLVKGLYNYLYDKFGRAPSDAYLEELLGVAFADGKINLSSLTATNSSGTSVTEIKHVGTYYISFKCLSSSYINCVPNDKQTTDAEKGVAKLRIDIVPKEINILNYNASQYACTINADGTDYATNVAAIIKSNNDLMNIIGNCSWTSASDLNTLINSICSISYITKLGTTSDTNVDIPIGTPNAMRDGGRYRLTLTIQNAGGFNDFVIKSGSGTVASFVISNVYVEINKMQVDVSLKVDTDLVIDTQIKSSILNVPVLEIVKQSGWYIKLTNTKSDDSHFDKSIYDPYNALELIDAKFKNKSGAITYNTSESGVYFAGEEGTYTIRFRLNVENVAGCYLVVYRSSVNGLLEEVTSSVSFELTINVSGFSYELNDFPTSATITYDGKDYDKKENFATIQVLNTFWNSLPDAIINKGSKSINDYISSYTIVFKGGSGGTVNGAGVYTVTFMLLTTNMLVGTENIWFTKGGAKYTQNLAVTFELTIDKLKIKRSELMNVNTTTVDQHVKTDTVGTSALSLEDKIEQLASGISQINELYTDDISFSNYSGADTTCYIVDHDSDASGNRYSYVTTVNNKLVYYTGNANGAKISYSSSFASEAFKLKAVDLVLEDNCKGYSSIYTNYSNGTSTTGQYLSYYNFGTSLIIDGEVKNRATSTSINGCLEPNNIQFNMEVFFAEQVIDSDPVYTSGSMGPGSSMMLAFSFGVNEKMITLLDDDGVEIDFATNVAAYRYVSYLEIHNDQKPMVA